MMINDPEVTTTDNSGISTENAEWQFIIHWHQEHFYEKY